MCFATPHLLFGIHLINTYRHILFLKMVKTRGMNRKFETSAKSIDNLKSKKNMKKRTNTAAKLRSKKSSSIENLLKLCRPLSVRLTKCDDISEPLQRYSMENQSKFIQ